MSTAYLSNPSKNTANYQCINDRRDYRGARAEFDAAALHMPGGNTGEPCRGPGKSCLEESGEFEWGASTE